MTDDDALSTRRNVLGTAGVALCGGLLAAGSASATECAVVEFWTDAYRDGSGDDCVGSVRTTIPAGTEGKVTDHCDHYAYFDATNVDPDYYGWVAEAALGSCTA